MPTLRKLLTTFAAALMMATASAGEKGAGILIVRNGSDFATLAFNVYRLEGGDKVTAKAGTVAPESVQMYSLPAGEYLATFAAANASASLSEGRFTLGAGEDYTINFRPKGKP